MKKIIKYIGLIILVMLGLFLMLVILIVFSAIQGYGNSRRIKERKSQGEDWQPPRAKYRIPPM